MDPMPLAGAEPMQHARDAVSQGVVIIWRIQNAAEDRHGGDNEKGQGKRTAEPTPQSGPATALLGACGRPWLPAKEKQNEHRDRQRNAVTTAVQLVNSGEQPAAAIARCAKDDPACQSSGGGMGVTSSGRWI